MIELIPAIDLMDGKCVRLTKGDYATRKTYDEDPVAVAREFESCGFRRLHVVDLDGARSGHVVNHKALERIASATGLATDFGGGIRSDEDLRVAFESGAALVTVGSVAVTRPELFTGWLGRYGPERIILGADVRGGVVSTDGWEKESTLELLPFLRRHRDEGVRHVLCTDIDKDGTLQGPSTGLYRKIMAEIPDCGLIASGGVGCLQDLVGLNEAGIPAVVFGKAVYEGRISLKELAEWAENGR